MSPDPYHALHYEHRDGDDDDSDNYERDESRDPPHAVVRVKARAEECLLPALRALRAEASVADRAARAEPPAWRVRLAALNTRLPADDARVVDRIVWVGACDVARRGAAA